MIMDNCTVFHNIDNFVNAHAVKSVFYTVTMIIGLFGNIIIVSTILKNKHLRTPMNISLVSLAFCDLIVCVCVLPLRLFLYSGTCDTPYTPILCRVDVFLKSMCDYVQPSMLVATSFERYKSIAKPFENKGKVKRIVVVISVTWCTCICCGAVSAGLFRDGATYVPCHKSYTLVQISTRALNYREGYVTLPYGISCIILVSIFYYLMIKTLHAHSKKMKKKFKAKPFKNKVKPAPAIHSIKETKMDTSTIEPIVVENNESNATDSPGQPTGTSIVLTDCSKNSPRPLKTFPEQNKNLLQVPEVIRKHSKSVSKDNNREFQSVEDATVKEPRRLSIRKTRESIFLPSSESQRLQSFSLVAKHVVFLKSHKKKSLYNMQNKRSANVAVDKHMNTASVSQYNIKSKPVHKNDEVKTKRNTENEIETENYSNIELKKLNSETLKLSTPGIRESYTKNESENISSDICESLSRQEKRKTNDILPEEFAQTNESKTFTGNKSNIFRQNTIESCCIHLDKDIKSETSGKHDALLKNSYENPTDGNSGLCNSSKNCISSKLNLGDENEKQAVINARENTILNVQENVNDLVNDSKEDVKQKIDNAKDKAKISNVDVVDFDGTVHKDVKVEGAVVGAVCVMNTTNRLEGRRKVEMRAAKRIAVMIGSFVLLWLPLPLIALFVSSRRQILSSDIEALLVSASISATTVAFNPILNLLLNKQLRSAATSLLTRAVNGLKRIKLH